jgi:hypothetical protein
MGMRASTQEQKGGIGQHEVAADFERIGWGVAHNSKHDLGTDLFLMARDHRLMDLGLVVGAQVKAGPRWFRRARRDRARNVIGWWFDENHRGHFDAWLAHQLPHIVVLHDLDTRVSYWAHVTDASVRYTGKGAKIFVPVENVVNAANAGKLLAIAASKASKVNWEGSAWAGATLSPSHELRHALLVPRLIAPHPNRGLTASPTAVQVVAMVVQVRLFDLLKLNEQHGSLPDLVALDPIAEWEWKFASGLRRFLTTGDPDVLRPLVDTTRAPHEQAAANAIYAAALLEDGRAGEAFDRLNALLGRDELDLVDQAWVQLQHARALRELGRRQEARDEAIDLINIAQRAPGDVTAAAIAGAAAHTVMTVSDWDSTDIETNISAADTTASWWRQQVSGWGLSAQVEKHFRGWGRDEAVTIGGGDKTGRHLRSASLLAGFLGDHNAWCHTIRQLAAYQLSDPDHGADPDRIGMALTTLRRAGDHKGIRLAARRAVYDGPAIAARTAVLDVRPETSTHTSAYADLRLLIEAGDLLPQDRAEEIVDWAKCTFLDVDGYVRQTRPTFDVHSTLIEVMNAGVLALGDNAQQELANLILALPAQADQGLAHPLAQLVRSLPATTWNLDRAQRAADRADADNWELTFALLGVAAPHVPDVRERLVAEAKSGSLNALDALGDVRTLSVDVVTALLESLTGKLETQMQDAASGRFSGGGHDLGRTVTLLNIWHPESANWDVVYRLLASTRWGRHLLGSLDLLATKASGLPADVARRLVRLAQTIADGPAPRPTLIKVVDPRPSARRLHAALQRCAGERSIDQLSRLARGDLDDRRAAASLARASDDELSMGVLVALAGDPHPQVRAVASRAIADRAAAGDTTARIQLPYLLQDCGVLVPLALASAVSDHPQLADLDEFQPLRTHISARVRVAFLSNAESHCPPPRPS